MEMECASFWEKQFKPFITGVVLRNQQIQKPRMLAYMWAAMISAVSGQHIATIRQKHKVLSNCLTSHQDKLFVTYMHKFIGACKRKKINNEVDLLNEFETVWLKNLTSLQNKAVSDDNVDVVKHHPSWSGFNAEKKVTDDVLNSMFLLWKGGHIPNNVMFEMMEKWNNGSN